jgi:hypothetical protein
MMPGWFKNHESSKKARRAFSSVEAVKTPSYWQDQVRTRDNDIKERDGRLNDAKQAHIKLEDDNKELREQMKVLMQTKDGE